MKIRMAHISMQFSDPSNEQHSDAEKVFDRAVQRDYCWITGTEANTGRITRIFWDHAKAHDFRFVRGGDCWIAVPKARIVKGTLDSEWHLVVNGQGGEHKHHFPDRGVLLATWEDKKLGRVSVLASHLQTHHVSADRPKDNVAITDMIGRLARQHGGGRKKVWYGGDQNIYDNSKDTFKGEPLTSCWDELKKHPPTHQTGTNIDVIASYDRDRLVSAYSAHRYTDKSFHLYTDHYLVEAVYNIKES